MNKLVTYILYCYTVPAEARFSKAPETFRARKAIAKSCVLWLQSCFIHVFLMWREVLFTQQVSGVYTSPFLDTDELSEWLYGPEKFSGLSRNGSQDGLTVASYGLLLTMGVIIYFCRTSPEIVVVFLVESYMMVIGRRFSHQYHRAFWSFSLFTLTLQINLRTLWLSCASLWTALRVVYDIAVWFCSSKSFEIGSSSCDCSSSSTLWLSLFLYARLSGFLRTLLLQ